jgi:hypothetical protein
MQVSITTQSNDRDDAVTMVIDSTVHTLYRGCRTLEDVRARCQKILDNYSIFQIRLSASQTSKKSQKMTESFS